MTKIDSAEVHAALALLALQPLEFDDWLVRLTAAFAKVIGEDEARKYVDGAGKESWSGYWSDAYTPSDAAHEDMTYWEG